MAKQSRKQSIPHTVRFPVWARNPQTSIENARKDGPVNNGPKAVSNDMNEAGTGSVVSGSIGGNPFLQRFHKHRRCSRIYCCDP
jgi:hypothetical protein